MTDEPQVNLITISPVHNLAPSHKSSQTIRLSAVAFALLLVVAQLVGGFPPLQPALAAAGESCFTVSDGNDTLYRYNYDGGPSYETIGAVGVPAIEAISWDPVNSILYAMDAGQLGTLNQTSGAFTAIGADSGLDMDGLGLDPFTGIMYGAVRRADGQSGGSGVYDDLATINITTGVVNVIGPISGAVDDTGDALFDIDDLAFDPTTGSLWGVANAGGNDTLVTVNKITGAVVQSVGEFGANDMEGLSWNDIGGLRGTTGAGQDLWDIDPTTGAASNPIALSPGSDFESLGCYRVAGPLSNTITGTVFLDADVDSSFGVGDTGTPGHTVNVYRDVNGDGLLTVADDVTFDAVLDSDDILASRSTNGSGFYSFTLGATGAFIAEVVTSTLPAASRLTTVSRRAVDFGTAFEVTDPDNDFGYTIPTIALAKTTSTPVIDAGDTATYSYQLSATGSESFPLANITVADDSCAPVAGPTSGDTNANNVLEPGETWIYGCSTTLSQDTTNTATATVVPAFGADLVEQDTAFVDVRPSIVVTKSAGAPAVPETGSPVIFTVTVENTSAENVTVDAIDDSDFGDILDPANPLVSATTCVGGSTVLPGAGNTYSCTFTAVVSGDASGPDHANTVTVGASDDEANTAGDADGATVSFTDVLPTVSVTKTAGVSSVNEPGATVTFTVDVENTSGEPVTLTALNDSDFSNLFVVPATTCSTALIAPGATYSCAFDGAVTGTAAGPDHSNTVTATVVDNEANTANDGDSETVGLDDVLPTIVVTKTANPTRVAASGGSVTFTVRVDNSGVEPVTLSSLSDSIYGDVANALNPALLGTTCALPQVIGVAGFHECTFTAMVAGTAGGSETDVVTATAGDDEGNSAVDNDDAVVSFADGSIGDFVWLDLDGDGVQDGGVEVGISGIDVGLYQDVDSSGTVSPGDVWLGSRTTNAGGMYSFTGMLEGDYVAVPDTGASLGAHTLTGGTDPRAVTLGVDEAYDTADFGYQPTGSIGDRVFIDVDGDGGFDAGEGIPDITVMLSDGRTTVTDVDGFYQFAAEAGSYTVTVDEADPDFPASALLTVGANPAPASIAAGETLTTVDFGYIIAGPGILLEKDPASQTVLTGSDVDFSITVTNVGNVALTGVTVVDPLVPDCDLSPTVLAPGATTSYTCTAAAVGADFTNTATATGTPPIGPDVTSVDTASVDVVDPAITISKDPASQTILSGSDAVFTITVTNTGDVDLTNVVVTDPLASACGNALGLVPAGGFATYSCTDPAVGANYTNVATVNADGPLGALTPVSDTADVVIDEATIAGRVWLDVDGDGIADPGEPGAGGVPVVLLDSGAAVVATATTDSNGDYDFDRLVPDTYTVRVDSSVLPVGSVATADPDGTLDDETSQAVVFGDEITGLDFGYQPPAAVTGLVFLDDDGDGLADPGELPLPGITVLVTDAGGTARPVLTDASGVFSAAVLAGQVDLDVDDTTLPGGHTLTTANDPQTVTAVAGATVTAPDVGYQPPVVDLSLTKVSTEGNVQPGDQAEWILTVTNEGSVEAAGPITLTDDLPAGLAYVSATGVGWTCGEAGSVVTCEHPGPLAAGAELSVLIVTDVAEDLSGTINNTAEVALVGDVNVLNNFAVAGVGLLPATGFNLADALTWAVVSMLLGAGLIAVTRRRDGDQDLVRNS
ncbi:MAG: SdrD B-like domain-containing protein [Acidimicrobiia bacterium]